MERQHGLDDVLGQRIQVLLGGGQVSVAHHPLQVGQRHGRVAGHPVGRRMTQVMQGPVRAHRRAGPREHQPGRIVGQCPERTPQRPPQRLIPPGGDQPVHLRLIQPQPHESIRRRRQLLQLPCPLADHRDQLLPRISIGGRRAQQLAGPRARRHPQRHQRPVPVRAQQREQLAEPHIRDLPRHPPGQLRPVPAGALGRERLHRVVMRVRPAAPPAPGQRERIDHRPGASLQVESVKATQHALAVHHRRRRIPAARGPLARYRVRRPRRHRRPQPRCPTSGIPPVRPHRLVSQPDPAAEVPGLSTGRLIPADPRRPQEPEPAKNIHPIRPLRRRRPPARSQFPEVRRSRGNHHPASVDQPERLEQIPGRLKRPEQRHHQPRQIPRRIPVCDHDQRP